MTFEQIMRDLGNRIYKPIYFLAGEEPYYIDEITNYISKNVLQESEKAFNQIVIYGKDSDLDTVINTAKRFPMMANHQVIIVKEAQHLKGLAKKEGSADDNDKDPLFFYASNPLKSTILVFNYKYKKPRKTKAIKAVEKNGVLFIAEKVKDYKIADWITGYLKEKELIADYKSIALLADYLGNDLSKITNEINKLCIAIDGKTRITPDDIEQHIGISKEFNTYELTKAIGLRDKVKCNSIIKNFARNQNAHPIPLLTAIFYGYFSKLITFHFSRNKSDERQLLIDLGVNSNALKEYRQAAMNYNASKTANAISIIRDFDVKSKGVDAPTTDYEDLLKELCFRIMS